MKKIWTLIPVLALVFSCQNEQEDPGTPAAKPVEEETVSVFYATMESQDSDTKVHADANLRVLWDAQDHISIFRKETANRDYIFAGATGDNAGEFAEAEGASPDPGEALSYYYAVYPYASATTIATDGTVSFTLPETQAYREGSFGLGASPMVAVAEDNRLLFKNAGSFLAFQLYGADISVTKVTLTGNKQEKLAGAATIQAALNADPVLTMGEGATEQVSIVCAEPVAIGADSENATVFWFVIPPTHFEEGFTITVEDSEGNTYEKSSDKERTLTRNHLVRMKAIELVKRGFGAYPASGDPYVYNPLTDQMNIYEAEGNGWFRFLVPELKVYELGPIPLDVAEGDTFNATLTVTTAGTQDSSTPYENLKVKSFQNGTLKLATEAGDLFIIRF